MAGVCLDFERPILELEKKIAELKGLASAEKLQVDDEIKRLERKAEKLTKEIYSKLSRWQRVQLARHPSRPYTLDFIKHMADDFIELHGDRLYADDAAIVAGLARIGERQMVVIGHEKGRTTKEKIERNFGMAHPDGFRKALRVMQMATKFKMPIVTFIDSSGAYPGIGAEERGISESIARNMKEMALLPVPIICVITGEGMSGGAIAIALGDRVLIMENAVYSTITPEGCASILWRDSSKAPQAAESLKVSAKDLIQLGVVDEIIEEPLGGAHRNHKEAAENVKSAILRHLAELDKLPSEELTQMRIDKFARIGVSS
ncbi:acetyl-CoA carboxylase carboxyltransferase subunit alpha [candidate division TA06 bacterium]|uniref:Acetyl-coenzyme A carboxylase carboxyl transferase subunit alpha n=1 Tax=candidate division TA06 bacterium TaxID=2250710 RepID=A0A523UMF3_UNCT6|nr:MAG: acetyl-CoA carboxylase carboxyltransferase subunit alpha [candidate division TA06 bacterium]